MTLLDQLKDADVWERFYEYKTSLCCPPSAAKELRKFIDGGLYLPVCAAIDAKESFPLPKKSVLSKLGTGKKRTVYTYPYGENLTMKLLTHLLLRRYDGLFADNLYSFRPGRSAKDAVRRLLRCRDLERMYYYKADIHDYFNSVPVPRLLPLLERALENDPALFSFLRSLLEQPLVLDRGKPVPERKGIMAGTPLACFYANLYLMDLDEHFARRGTLYLRYSDDIIIFAPSEAEVRAHADFLRASLQERGLSLNPKKEHFGSPGEGWTFLGFSCREGKVDIAPATVEKLKKKMRRKTRALRRWSERNGVEGEKAAKAFLRVFRRKLLESPENHELTWSYWFFSVINTADSLGQIDRYAQDCLRYLISGRRTKARFNVRYADLKALGYESLVHAYYAFSPGGNETAPLEGAGCALALPR